MATAGNGGTAQTSPGTSSDENGNSAATGILELEQLLKQVTVTRFKIQHPAAMENLPNELLANIFICLQARQLAQMRSISKSWNVLLSQPTFVKSHLHRSILKNNQQILLVFHDNHERFTQLSCQSRHLEPTNFIQHIPNNLPDKVIGSVNGLVCLTSEDTYPNIRIWNASLSAVSILPQPYSAPIGLDYETSIRFGFDPNTDDYKLVKIVGVHSEKNYFSVKEWLQVEVYSTRKGCWELITQRFPSHIKEIHNTDYLCGDGHDGHLHWQNQTGPLRDHSIVGFDLGSETFREIHLPDSMLDSNHDMHQLGVLDGKLCEISWRKDGGWEVWVMEEYGVHESWTKRHVFSSQLTDDWIYLYGFTSHNELLVEDIDHRLVLYDPVAKKTKFTRANQRAGRFVEYVDSLVWI